MPNSIGITRESGFVFVHYVAVCVGHSNMASRFHFYSFSGCEFLISTINILTSENWIYTSNSSYVWYQQFNFN